MTILDPFLNYAAEQLSVEYFLVNLIFCLALTFPISYLNFQIKNPQMRLIYGLVFGLLLQYQMYRLEIIHLIISTLYTYFFIYLFGRKYSAFIVIILNIFHLSFLHIKRMINSYGAWDISIDVLYMMSICKFSSIAFAYEDGAKENDKIQCKYWKTKKIEKIPTLLETFSYIFYFPSSLIGPSFEFADFLNFINSTKEYKQLPQSKCVKNSFKQLLIAVLCMIVYVLGLKRLHPFYVLSEEYSNKSLTYKFLFYMVSTAFNVRAKYYSGFKMSEAAVIFCGLGYGINEKIETNDNDNITENENLIHNVEEKFDKISNVDILSFEFDANPVDKINSWNSTVHLWLKYQVFLRLINLDLKIFKDNKSLASMTTFMISAVWHGFYPVYYIFFIHFYLIEQSAKIAEEKLKFFTRLNSKHLIIRLAFNFILMGIMCNLGISFCLLTISNLLKFYSEFYFIPNLIILFVYLYLAFVLKKSNKEIKKKND